MVIHLYHNNGSKKWLEHPNGREIDVVAVRLPSDICERFVVKAVQETHSIPNNVLLSPGEDLIVIGFPLGFYDEVNNLPVVRNAALSSAHNVAFEAKPYFLVDSRLHSGSSGSPVWTKPRDQLCTTDGSVFAGTAGPGGYFFFAGIFSMTFDPKRNDSEDEPLGLNAVWFPTLIPEIVAGSNLPAEAQ